jgi:uncharacterized membrane protein YczE
MITVLSIILICLAAFNIVDWRIRSRSKWIYLPAAGVLRLLFVAAIICLVALSVASVLQPALGAGTTLFGIGYGMAIHVFSIIQRHHTKRSNRTMQPTAGRSDAPL